MHKCQKCKKLFKTKKALYEHQITHSEKNKKYNSDLKAKRQKEYYKNPKQCKNCNKIIHYKKRKNNFCNSSCMAKYWNKGRKKTNFCLNCKKLVRKKFCNHKCQQEYKYKQYIKDWKNGKIEGGRIGGVPNYIKKYLFKKNNNKCQKCGWKTVNKYTGNIPLEIEHKDGNYKNNTEKNLELICPNCHSLTATYKGANKGNGRSCR